jgi:hypothetical protein
MHDTMMKSMLIGMVAAFLGSTTGHAGCNTMNDVSTNMGALQAMSNSVIDSPNDPDLLLAALTMAGTCYDILVTQMPESEAISPAAVAVHMTFLTQVKEFIRLMQERYQLLVAGKQWRS